jgi:hypothetical protein
MPTARKLTFRTSAILAVFGGLAFANPGALAALSGKIVIPGSYHTTQKDAGYTAYDKENTTVTADYTIKTKVDPATGKLIFDYDNSYVTFTNKFGGQNFTTTPVPITLINGDPNTGEVISFQFAGTNWDPKRPAGGRQYYKSDGISGSVFVIDKTAVLHSSYINSKGGIGSYTFATYNKNPAPAKKDPKTGNPGEADTSMSLSYNGATQTLSIGGDTVVGTSYPSDPIVGAGINFLSDYDFTGFTADGKLAIFWSSSGEGSFSVSNGDNLFETGDLPILFYDLADNLFYGTPIDLAFAGMPTTSPFYNPSMSSTSSPFLNGLEDMLDPASPYYDPTTYLYWTISPGTNIDLATNGFMNSASGGATDAEFVAAEVPEPSTWGLMITAFVGLGSLRLWRRRALAVHSTATE